MLDYVRLEDKLLLVVDKLFPTQQTSTKIKHQNRNLSNWEF